MNKTEPIYIPLGKLSEYLETAPTNSVYRPRDAPQVPEKKKKLKQGTIKFK